MLIGGVVVVGSLPDSPFSGRRAPAETDAAGPAHAFQWEDYMNPPFLHEYERAWHDDPKITIFADEDEAFAKMRAGFTPDVMGPCY